MKQFGIARFKLPAIKALNDYREVRYYYFLYTGKGGNDDAHAGPD